MSEYKNNLTRAMTMLSENEKTIFIGQSVRFGGQAMFSTFAGVPMRQRIEMPVAEDMQLGYCIGLALQGFLPICIYPRIDFMLLALNQLVNHLDIMQPMPKLIIRTAIGSKYPMNAGPQHTKDLTPAIMEMMQNIDVMCPKSDDLIEAYRWAAQDQDRSTIIVEYADNY